MYKKLFFRGLVLLVLLLLVSCSGYGSSGVSTSSRSFNPDVSLSLSGFSSDHALKSFENNLDIYGLYGGVSPFRSTKNLAIDSQNIVALEDDFSSTNNQVNGVDEADMMKTDGRFVYLLDQDNLFIVSAEDNISIVSRLNFSFSPKALFISGNRLVVLGSSFDNFFVRNLDIGFNNAFSFLNIYDVSDPSKISLLDSFKFEGSFDEARLLNGFVYLITDSFQSINNPRPLYFEGSVLNKISLDDIVHFNIPYDNLHSVNIFSIDLDSRKLVSSKSVFTEFNPVVYVSNDNLFLTFTKRIDEYKIRQEVTIDLVSPLLSKDDIELIERINAVDDDVLSKSEKRAKVLRVIYRFMNSLDSSKTDLLNDEILNETRRRLSEFEYRVYSVVSKFALESDGSIKFLSSVLVPGSVLNQFSLDESSDGFLRIVSHIDSYWDSFSKNFSKSSNVVVSLDDDLVVLDVLKDLAPDERIYSSRFVGDRLYLVTFKRVDPFFVIDLSDPKNLSVLGVLKIPGYSSYLHPYSDDVIIGLGRDASSSGSVNGLKISLFNVSDVSNPTLLSSFKADGSYSSSIAEFDHHAFLFDRSKNLLVVPVRSFDWKSRDSYNGAFVFNISESSIVLRGLIDHSQGFKDRFYSSGVQRSLYIGNLLFTKSSGLLRVNDLRDLSSIADLPLKSLIHKPPMVYY